MANTYHQYNQVIKICKEIFIQKAKDYGTSWRMLRPISIVDQIFIKAQRVRTIQGLGTQRVEDKIDNEFKGIVNYGIIALIQSELGNDSRIEIALPEMEALYDKKIFEVRELMMAKNHDYGEAWRSMSQESFVDLILVKLLRIRQILQNDGKTLISEGPEANFQDIINYGVFALIKMSENSPVNL
ncbi:MAG: DUF1599 domain-containing protein [Chitinophagaceae bacterium]